MARKGEDYEAQQTCNRSSGISSISCPDDVRVAALQAMKPNQLVIDLLDFWAQIRPNSETNNIFKRLVMGRGENPKRPWERASPEASKATQKKRSRRFFHAG
nr:hypothetical protein Iba_chr11dCG1930 [Ipomoea batatas]GMD58134.1 hypothetical protein Iba_chr11fCG2670 [Ipomoea batatas]